MESYYGHHRGGLHNQYGRETHVNVPAQESSSFQVPSLQALEPENVRRLVDVWADVLNIGPSDEKVCQNFKLITTPDGVFENELILSGQQGYKTKDFRTQGLKGTLGALGQCPVSEAEGLASRFVPEDTEESFVASVGALNDTKNQASYGYEEYKNPEALVGANILLLKGHADDVKEIYPFPRAGAKISGYYSGYKSVPVSIDKTLRDHENHQL